MFKNFRTLNGCQKGEDKQRRPRFASLTSILSIAVLISNILFENRKSKGFEVIENLPYTSFNEDNTISYTKSYSTKIAVLKKQVNRKQYIGVFQ